MENISTMEYDIVIIGGGPAGLAAALSAKETLQRVILVEREDRVGGILKQCIHDGFGLITFKEKLTGPEYAHRFIKRAQEEGLPVMTATFVLEVKKSGDYFYTTVTNIARGIVTLKSKALILATGCRERTSRQVFINGTRPAGIYTAGTAQYLVNLKGYLPCKKCVILGSGDIGLIMARRLTLEGAEVEGVYEAKPTPSGLNRNIVQCLKDYNIPLHLSHTVTEVYGRDRVEGVLISQVDENMKPIMGTERRVDCDGIILSVGLIPENELAESLNITMDTYTKGPKVDSSLMTSVEGCFCCGNALQVNDLVDYVTESGNLAGIKAGSYCKKEAKLEPIELSFDFSQFLYAVPQRLLKTEEEQVLYFRTRSEEREAYVKLTLGEDVIFKKLYKVLRPAELEKISIKLPSHIDGVLKLSLCQREGE